MPEVSIQQLVDLTGMARKTITNRLDASPPLEPLRVAARAKVYDSTVALRRIYDAATGETPGQSLARLNSAKADLAELELEVKRGDSIPRADHEKAILALASPVVMKLAGVPTKSAPEARAAESDAEAEAVIRRHIEEAQTEIADLAKGLPGPSGSA